MDERVLAFLSRAFSICSALEGEQCHRMILGGKILKTSLLLNNNMKSRIVLMVNPEKYFRGARVNIVVDFLVIMKHRDTVTT
jgi:hypothetical protein